LLEVVCKGHRVLIDDEDLKLFNNHSWCVAYGKGPHVYLGRT
jgi:hypothetical protein